MGTAALDRLDRFTDIAEQLGLLIWPVVCTPSEWSHHFQQLYLRGKPLTVPDPSAVIEALLDAGVVSELEVAGARALSRQKDQPLDEVLLDQGLISREQRLRTRARLLGIPAASVPEATSCEVASCLPAPIARACQVVPLDRANDRLIVGMLVPDSAQIALIEVERFLAVDSQVPLLGEDGYSDLMVMAGDMATHLNLARRVLDNLTPGFGNLGEYCLLLLHVLELPFVWHDKLWRSGLAGGIVSMAAFIGGSVLVFKLARLLLEDNVAAFMASATFFTNPLLLYFQAAPMFEPLLVTTFVAAV